MKINQRMIKVIGIYLQSLSKEWKDIPKLKIEK